MSKYTLNDFEPGAYRILWEDGQSRGGCIFTSTAGVKMIVCSNWVWPGVLSDELGGIVEAVRLDNPPRVVPRGPFPPPPASDGAVAPHDPIKEAAGFTGIHGRLNALYQIFDDLRSVTVNSFADLHARLDIEHEERDDRFHKLQVEQAGIVSLLEAIHGEVSSPPESDVEAVALDAMIYGTGVLRDGKRVDPKDYFCGVDLGKDDFSVFGFVDSAGRFNIYSKPEGAGELRQHVEVFGRHLLLFDGGLYLIEGGKLVKL